MAKMPKVKMGKANMGKPKIGKMRTPKVKAGRPGKLDGNVVRNIGKDNVLNDRGDEK